MYCFIKHKALLMIAILICAVFTIHLIVPAATASSDKVCCEKTNDDEYCVYTDSSNCDTSYRSTNQPVECDETAYCQLGCCKTAEGSCLKSVAHATCTNEDPENEWTSDPLCAYPECAAGCCAIGTECSYITEEQCEAKQELYPNATYSFSSGATELECSDICRAQESGCCVEEDEVCTYTTRDACTTTALTNATSIIGFHQGVYCSDDALNSGDISCGCTAHDSKKCVDDYIHWVDSCGNQEEEDEYCDYNDDLVCTEDEDVEYGAYCKSVDCATTQAFSGNPSTGVARKNGESWCVYDGAVGAGGDLVGSRHFRHICIDGEELVEPCRDFREEFCVQLDITDTEKGTYREASCTNNRWEDCATTCNTAKDETDANKRLQAMKKDKECCEKSDVRDCMWVGEENVGRCIPIISPGFAHWGGSEDEEEGEGTGSSQDNGAATCSIAESSCTVVWEKKSGFDDWDLKYNKECIKEGGKEFAQGFNSYCRSLGDCGAHFNIAGRATYDGYSCVSDDGSCDGAGKHGDHFNIDQPDIGSFSDYENAGEGIYLGTKDKDDVPTGLEGVWENAPAAVIATGVALVTLGALTGSIGTLGLGGFTSIATVLANAAFTTTASGAAGATVSGGMSSTFAGSAAAAGVGAIAAIVLFVVILVLIIVLLIYILGADSDDFEIELSCGPWQAPSGGADCHLCDEDPFKECSEYRCRSLGTTCRLINEDTSEATCIDSNPNDANSPVISPDPAALTENYSLSTTSTGYKITPEITAYSPISFGIKTNEPAKCKINNEHTTSYDDMPSVFIGSEYYTEEKNITINPVANETYKYYIRCEDAVGNANGAEYLIQFETEAGPDYTAPIIEFTDPSSGTYIANGINDTYLIIYTNEKSQCKWDKEDTSYNFMKNNFSCIDSGSTNALTLNYFTCNTQLTNITLGQNDYYIRCQDLSGNNNTNAQSTVVTLFGTEKLQITSTSPYGMLWENDQTLTVSTSKGALSGSADCYYSETETTAIGNMIQFYETGATVHKQNLQDLDLGNYLYWVICEDIAGNEANATINFTIGSDLSPPLIKELSRSQTHLTLSMNEPSSCLYSALDFDWPEGTMMEGINTTMHSLQISNLTYYVLCNDNFGNVMTKPLVIFV